MNIVIRTDSSSLIGSGHVMRCLTLAEACRNQGATVSFVCRRFAGSLIDVITARNFPVFALDPPGPSDKASGWLGADVDEDAQETWRGIEALAGTCDWLIADQYGIGARWESVLTAKGLRIMAIDDLADRTHECDLLLDQNFRRSSESRYEGLVPARCTVLQGPHFALLQADYAAWRAHVVPRQDVKRVLVYFGGSDSLDLTLKSARAALSFDHLHVDAVVSADLADAQELRELSAGHARLAVHTRLPSLAPLIASNDLAIGAFGATSWERLCLGLPTIGATLADNQREVAHELDRAGLAVNAGAAETLTEAGLVGHIAEALATDDLADWSRRCMAICDGLGTTRVVDTLLASRNTA